MLYLMEKINIDKSKCVIEVVLSNMFAIYPGFLLAGNNNSAGGTTSLQNQQFFSGSSVNNHPLDRIKLQIIS